MASTCLIMDASVSCDGCTARSILLLMVRATTPVSSDVMKPISVVRLEVFMQDALCSSIPLVHANRGNAGSMQVPQPTVIADYGCLRCGCYQPAALQLDILG